MFTSVFVSKVITDSDNGDDSDEEVPVGQNDKTLSTTTKRPKQRKVQESSEKVDLFIYFFASSLRRHTLLKFYQSVSVMIRPKQWLHCRII